MDPTLDINDLYSPTTTSSYQAQSSSIDPFANLFRNKTVLITGGTGFLGRQLVRRLLQYDVQSIRLFSRDEVKHFHTSRDFDKHEKLRHLIGDIRDYSRLRKAFRGVDIVIHAAALKRIDIIEYNVEESIQTNVVGTLNVARAAWDERVPKVLFVSTDKACSPVNTYGACKFIGERIFTEWNYSKGNIPSIFLSVRYGNVLDSTGSVIPCFTKAIKEGKSISLTDDRMTRFIITPDEAVDLIFAALKDGQGGEVFIPKLPAFKITDLIEVMQRHYNSSVPVTTIGIRPGEKIHEILTNECEGRRAFHYGKYVIIKSDIEKHRQGDHYSYLQGALPVDFDEMSSKDFVIDQATLYSLLLKDNLLK